jgi:hypothetical protein
MGVILKIEEIYMVLCLATGSNSGSSFRSSRNKPSGDVSTGVRKSFGLELLYLSLHNRPDQSTL